MLAWLLLAAVPLAPELRAIAYLAREVPAWPQENHCFSCHNNGDAARALYAAHRLRYRLPAKALITTTQWLRRPVQWGRSPGEPASSDQRLARLQFAAALTEAYDAGLVRDRRILLEAAESLLPLQAPDGHWPLAGGDTLGSPVTYGLPLATHLARRTLQRADPARFTEPIDRASAWLRAVPVRSVLDAAAVVLALGPQRPDARDYLLGAQTVAGGWGPYPNSPPEPFDTALAMLALPPDRLGRARAWLLQVQLPTGDWPETTRPAGNQSYAQHVSTTAWATLALLATSPETALPPPRD